MISKYMGKYNESVVLVGKVVKSPVWISNVAGITGGRKVATFKKTDK